MVTFINRGYRFVFLGLTMILILTPFSSVKGGSLIAQKDSVLIPLPPKLKNPIKADTLTEFIKSILEAVITIGIPIVALAIIYSGFLFVTAQGDIEKLKKAKDTFFWTIVGSAILLGSWVLAQAIGATIEQLRT